ncbi:beta-mannosyltransferase [Synechococcus phage DSL-LC02]|nr:beta-mannosyltransferase [Synechococcus phage DSL-LC02]
MKTFAQVAFEKGGSIHPLIIDSEITNGLGLMNPSIYIDNGKIIVNLRSVNYTFYHSEEKLFQHPYGPLTYVHPENDIHLRTWNYYLELNDNYEIERYCRVDTSSFPNKELWEFIGLEDARIFRWNGKLYLSGVRRDEDKIGTGRMELCEIVVTGDRVKQISQLRIQPPLDPNSYCEKNWMPILDKPYHYIKWSNPTELVKIDLVDGSSEQIFTDDPKEMNGYPRGGSQLVPWKDGYVAITHEVDLFKSEVGRKDAVYYHRVMYWDKNFRLQKFSKRFSIMGGHVEFCVGLAIHNGNMLMTFGFQDNAAYLLKFDESVLEEFLNG